MFYKKYEQSFTDEVFTVTDQIAQSPPVYILKDFDGEPIEGSFYVYVYVFSRRFYPKRLTNEDITSYKS